jgi:beta-galactosidase
MVFDTKSSSQSIAPFEQVEIAQMAAIKTPKLWSPEEPNLYKVLTEVSVEGNIVDTYETTFGVRTVEINKDGVFLNGKLCPLREPVTIRTLQASVLPCPTK